VSNSAYVKIKRPALAPSPIKGETEAGDFARKAHVSSTDVKPDKEFAAFLAEGRFMIQRSRSSGRFIEQRARVGSRP